MEYRLEHLKTTGGYLQWGAEDLGMLKARSILEAAATS
jgi:hypothetical protein